MPPRVVCWRCGTAPNGRKGPDYAAALSRLVAVGRGLTVALGGDSACPGRDCRTRLLSIRSRRITVMLTPTTTAKVMAKLAAPFISSLSTPHRHAARPAEAGTSALPAHRPRWPACRRSAGRSLRSGRYPEDEQSRRAAQRVGTRWMPFCADSQYCLPRTGLCQGRRWQSRTIPGNRPANAG